MVSEEFKDVSHSPLLQFLCIMYILQEERLRAITKEIKSIKSEIEDILHKDSLQGSPNGQRMQYFLHTLRIFQAEFCTHLRDWNELSQVVDASHFWDTLVRN